MIDVAEYSEEVEQERFKVNNLNKANWCLKKISEIDKELKDNEIAVALEKERWNTWLGKKTEEANSKKEYFKSLLNEYLQELRKDNPKAKISTPYGTVSTRKTQIKWNYDDEKIKSFLKDNGMSDYIRTKEEIDKSSLKKALKVAGTNVIDKDGQIVDGITIEPSKEEITVKVVE